MVIIEQSRVHEVYHNKTIESSEISGDKYQIHCVGFERKYQTKIGKVKTMGLSANDCQCKCVI